MPFFSTFERIHIHKKEQKRLPYLEHVEWVKCFRLYKHTMFTLQMDNWDFVARVNSQFLPTNWSITWTGESECLIMEVFCWESVFPCIVHFFLSSKIFNYCTQHLLLLGSMAWPWNLKVMKIFEFQSSPSGADILLIIWPYHNSLISYHKNWIWKEFCF